MPLSSPTTFCLLLSLSLSLSEILTQIKRNNDPCCEKSVSHRDKKIDQTSQEQFESDKERSKVVASDSELGSAIYIHHRSTPLLLNNTRELHQHTSTLTRHSRVFCFFGDSTPLSNGGNLAHSLFLSFFSYNRFWPPEKLVVCCLLQNRFCKTLEGKKN